AGEQTGRAERFREAIVDQCVDVLDFSFRNVRACGVAGGVGELKRNRSLDLSALDFEERSRIELNRVVDLAVRIAELEVVADAEALSLIAAADEAFASADQQAE